MGISLAEKNKIYQEWVREQKDKPFIKDLKEISEPLTRPFKNDAVDSSSRLTDPYPSSTVIEVFECIVKSLDV
jgi:hypothetical protein